MEFENQIENDRKKSRKQRKAEARKGATFDDSFPDVGIEEETPAQAVSDGVEIDRFAMDRNLATEDVWRQIRSGKLLGKLVEGKVLVFESELSAERFSATSPFNFSELPPFPGDLLMSLPTNQTTRSETNNNSPEIALLIDHLSIAKEENREIIRLTQDALQKMEELNKQIISMKDDSICERDEKIERLTKELQQQNEKILKLQRDKEDLETLTRSISI